MIDPKIAVFISSLMQPLTFLEGVEIPQDGNEDVVSILVRDDFDYGIKDSQPHPTGKFAIHTIEKKDPSDIHKKVVIDDLAKAISNAVLLIEDKGIFGFTVDISNKTHKIKYEIHLLNGKIGKFSIQSKGIGKLALMWQEGIIP